jgi:hypothetical protein
MPATEKDMEGVNSGELKKLEETWEQQEVRLRKIYLQHPNRKIFFVHDFVEALWFHMLDFYGKSIGDAEAKEMIDYLMDDDRPYEIVYDIAEEIAERRGWEMK